MTFELTDELFEQFLEIRHYVMALYKSDPTFRTYLAQLAEDGR